MFVKRELLPEEAADAMLAWPHSGFHVHHHVRIDTGDAKGRAHVARYAARAPVALSRITYDADTDMVSLASDKEQGPTAGTHRLHALEFLARLLSHVPHDVEVTPEAVRARRKRWAELPRRIWDVDVETHPRVHA